MLVSWPWLSEYVELAVSHEELANRFAMSGLNHEHTTLDAQGQPIINLEVTSNRGDCLGHIGVAREAAVLLGRPLKIPAPQPPTSSACCEQSISVENRFPSCCTRYTARVIRGVKVQASPAWLAQRLAAVGIASINNVVDVTNYVMLECGQPLHAFDLRQIRGNKVVIRPAQPNEKFLAIDHKNYQLDEQMVVIADAERAVALGGVMGGAESEISAITNDLLIEAALFQPLSIRRTARKLKLHSPSSFRFERKPDPAGVDWASLRCCELILKLAGGTLEKGSVSVGELPGPRDLIVLRWPQVSRVLGIEIPQDRIVGILSALGCTISKQDSLSLTVVPPSWRSDLTREIDLIEEVARIYGYEQIPENAVVPLAVAQPRRKDLAVQRVRHVLSARGIDEAMTPSVVTDALESVGSPWTSQPPLSTEAPLLEGARLLRRSLIPSLLASRHTNQTHSIRNAQLYEIANIVLAAAQTGPLPLEQSTLGIVTAADLSFLKGVVQSILDQLGGSCRVRWETVVPEVSKLTKMFMPGAMQCIKLNDRTIGWLGLCDDQLIQNMHLDQGCAIAEMNLDALTELLVEVRRAEPYSQFPAVQRDLNFVVSESLLWAELEQVCRQQGGQFLQRVEYRETYRDTKKDGAQKKRVLLTLQFQSHDRTLTGEEVDQAVQQIVQTCQDRLAAHLLATG